MDEIGTDEIDFNIQRLGLWIKYNQKSAISRAEWEAMQVGQLPKLKGKLFVGIKFGHDGTNVAVSVAVKTGGDKVFVENKLKAPVLPTVKEIIAANASFEQGLFNQNIKHMGQPSLVQAVSNCEKRAIGTNGGFGYKSLRDDIEVALLDSVILAYWKCNESKEKRKQRVSY